MKKNLRNRNIVTHYIRTKHLPIYTKFIEVANKDENFTKLRYKRGMDITSVALVQLMANYLNSKGINIKELTEDNETTNQNTNQET